MRSFTPPDLDRRSGADRRHNATAQSPARHDGLGDELAAPFTLPPSLITVRPRDPWAAVVGRALADYADGRGDDLVRSWDDRLVWRVVGGWPAADQSPADRAFAYHRELHDATLGTFRQEVVSIDGSGGPIVVAHVRTTAVRKSRRLDMPSLLTFELIGMRIQRVTEIPGDCADWDAFWAD